MLKNCKTIEELKIAYKKLAMKYHPDLGGNVKDMQDLNSEYDLMLKKLKTSSTDKKDHNYNIDTDVFKDIIDKLITLDVEIEICGSWLWVGGNTKPVKDTIKEAGLQWAKKKEKWYYKPEDSKTSSRGQMSMQDIRDKYGSERIPTKTPPTLK